MKRLNRKLKRVRPLLGTYVEIEIHGHGLESEMNARIGEGFDAISEIERLMSYYRTDSDLSRVNESPAGKWTKVHSFSIDVFKMTNHFFMASDGVFDIRCAPRLVRWGFLPPSRRPGRSPSGFHRKTPPLEFDGGRVRKTGAWTMDLGGIAKGFAVDHAVAVLGRYENISGIVNAGGDLRAFGEKTWPISIRDPKSPARSIRSFQLRQGAIATSGTYFSRRRWEKKWVSPLVDPLNTRPFLDRYSVTVAAPTCAVADALTKIIALRPAASNEILNRFKSRAFLMGLDGVARDVSA